MSESECNRPLFSSAKSNNTRKSTPANKSLAKMRSESECNYPLFSSAKSNNTRKSTPANKSLAKMRQKPQPADVFGISHRNEDDDTTSTRPVVLSYFINKVAMGTEQRYAYTTNEYYVDLKVYHTSDVRDTDPMELWKKALVRIKFQCGEDTVQWRELQALVESLDLSLRTS